MVQTHFEFIFTGTSYQDDLNCSLHKENLDSHYRSLPYSKPTHHMRAQSANIPYASIGSIQHAGFKKYNPYDN